jgi:hypothetical protein
VFAFGRGNGSRSRPASARRMGGSAARRMGAWAHGRIDSVELTGGVRRLDRVVGVLPPWGM